jgi:hypothetical protein
MNLEERLGAIDRLFRAERIDYAIIGAFAVAAWGEVRGTRDLDLLVEGAMIEHVSTALERSGYTVEVRLGDEDDPIAAVVRAHSGSGEELQQVDVLTGIRGAPAGIVVRARPVLLGSLAVSVASPEDMIVLKLLAGSVQDLEDARGIALLQGDRLSHSLLTEICPAVLKPALDAILGGTG